MFDRVLEQDMGFFEGNGGIPSGDVANRITTEASDIAETVHDLLNVSLVFHCSFLVSLYLLIFISCVEVCHVVSEFMLLIVGVVIEARSCYFLVWMILQTMSRISIS